MNILAPSMLSIDFNHMEENLKAVRDAGATHIHVDIMDAHFVPNLAFSGYNGPNICSEYILRTSCHQVCKESSS